MGYVIWFLIVIAGFIFGFNALAQIIYPLFFSLPRVGKLKRERKLVKPIPLFALLVAPFIWTILLVVSIWLVNNYLGGYVQFYYIVLGLVLIVVVSKFPEQDIDLEADFNDSWKQYLKEPSIYSGHKTASVERLEKQISPKLRWKTIEEIPDFPLRSFSDVTHNIEEERFSIGIDYDISNQYAIWLYGPAHELFFALLVNTPFIVAIALGVLALFLRSYWPLFGIVLAFVGYLLGFPRNPLNKSFKSISVLVVLFSLLAFWRGLWPTALLSDCLALTFFIEDFVNNMNQNKLKWVALNSEKIFVFLYQNGKLGLKDNKNAKTYWNYPTRSPSAKAELKN